MGSDVDLPDPQNSGFSLRKSWDSTQEGAGLEVISQKRKTLGFYTELPSFFSPFLLYLVVL